MFLRPKFAPNDVPPEAVSRNEILKSFLKQKTAIGYQRKAFFNFWGNASTFGNTFKEKLFQQAYHVSDPDRFSRPGNQSVEQGQGFLAVELHPELILRNAPKIVDRHAVRFPVGHLASEKVTAGQELIPSDALRLFVHFHPEF